MTKTSEKFHPETVWPTVEIAGELEHKLRYGMSAISGCETRSSEWMTREDELILASILSAYIHLRNNPGSDWKQKLEAAEALIPDDLTKSLIEWLNEHNARVLGTSPKSPPKAVKEEKEEWAWCLKNAETANGPFPDRQSALDEAMAECDRGESFFLGTVKYAKPSEYVFVDIDDLANSMDEAAGEGDFSFWDDVVFELRPPGSVVKGGWESYEGPQKELSAFLEEWADRWFTSTVWVIDVKERFER